MGRRFRVSSLASPIQLDSAATHHLVHVMRAEPGTQIVVFDGMGRECDATLTEVVDGQAQLSATSSKRVCIPPREVALILGLPKGPAIERSLRMATEAGATSIHPVWAARTQGKPSRMERWKRVVESSCAQSGRSDIPELHEPSDLSSVLTALPHQLVVADGEGTSSLEFTGSVALAVGPEGGWDPAEHQLFSAHSALSLRLAPYILRTDTAVAAGISRLA